MDFSEAREMRLIAVLCVVLVVVSVARPASVGPRRGGRAVADASAALTLHTYEARIRVSGRVSTTTVQARDAGHAKQLVRAQYGDRATVLSVKRIN